MSSVNKPDYCFIIGRLMNDNDESQEVLASAIGVNRDRINNWLNGRSKIDYKSLIKVAEHYHVTTDYLLGLSRVKSANIELQGAEQLTGLSEDSLKKLSFYNEQDTLFNDTLDYLLSNSSDDWFSISKAIYNAGVSLRILKSDGNPDTNTDVLTMLIDMKKQFGDAVSMPNMPDLPKGTMILSASDTSEYYKVKAIKTFSKFVDDYVECIGNLMFHAGKDDE